MYFLLKKWWVSDEDGRNADHYFHENYLKNEAKEEVSRNR